MKKNYNIPISEIYKLINSTFSGQVPIKELDQWLRSQSDFAVVEKKFIQDIIAIIKDYSVMSSKLNEELAEKLEDYYFNNPMNIEF